MKITVELNEESQRILAMANDKRSEVSNETFVSELLAKFFEQQERTIARQRLNSGKKGIHMLVSNGHFKSLEAAYNAVGLSQQVQAFGGIRKVYDDIYQKSGLVIDLAKIRTQIEAVPASVAKGA